LDISKQLAVTLSVEAFLVFLTLFLLSEPGWMIKSKNEGTRAAFRAGGLLFLCVTFCWSFILGCILAIQRLTFHV
jgi:hypothetical protein